MQLERMQTHESLQEKLTSPDDNAIVHFISHEWLGFRHPDPEGTQVQLMQSTFEKFIAGKARELLSRSEWEAFVQGVSSGTGAFLRPLEGSFFGREALTEEDLRDDISLGCVWLDYHSIPQDTQKSNFVDAVNSIPYYVERCDYFWICAPRAVHHDLHEPRDFYTWRGRGWCRLEEMTNILCRTLKMPLVVAEPNKVCTYGFLDGLQYLGTDPLRSVANGKFTCCLFNHKVPQPDGSFKEIKCDKLAVAPVVATVFQALYSHVCGSGDRFKKSLLGSFATAIFAGFASIGPDAAAVEEEWMFRDESQLDDFLEKFGYASLDNFDPLGWPPLMWAMCCAEMPIIKEMLRLRPEMLFAAAPNELAMVAYSVHRDPADFHELLRIDARARTPEHLSHSSASGYTAVDRAAKYGRHENLRTLLEFRASVDPVRKDNGATPFLSAAEEGFPECLEVLMEHRADIQAVDHQGRNALHLAAPHLAIMGNDSHGARVKAIHVLLAARVDAKRVDSHGRTPLQIALEGSHIEAVQLLGREPK